MNIKLQTALWTMQSGEKIRICDMDDRHLVNTFKMIERVAGTHMSSHLAGANTACLIHCHGDIAAMELEAAYDEICDKTLEDYLPEIYYDMKKEIEIRELEVRK